MSIQIKRIYESCQPQDGVRVLVDRVWPRGVSRTEAHLDAWLKEIAPSPELRRWFDHRPERWDEFRRRYFAELADHDQALEDIRKQARHRRVTLLYGARERQFNNAHALAEYLRRGRQHRP